MQFNVRVSPQSIKKLFVRFQPDRQRMRLVSEYLHSQVKSRFLTKGQSGGVKWPLNWLGTLNDFDHVYDTFVHRADATQAIVASRHPHADVLQLGTKGKGGTMNTIRPRRAKVLFVPVTKRARLAYERNASKALKVRQVGGNSVSVVEPKLDLSRFVKGRIFNHNLQKWNGQEFVNGVPDYLFLSKVDISPRPMLPDSTVERCHQVNFLVHTLIVDQP